MTGLVASPAIYKSHWRTKTKLDAIELINSFVIKDSTLIAFLLYE